MGTRSMNRTQWDTGQRLYESAESGCAHLVLTDDLPISEEQPCFELANFPPYGFLFNP